MQADGFHPKLSICGNSTGLDSTTAFEILLAMRVWATETGGTVLATLLQVGHRNLANAVIKSRQSRL
jgi:hypothetical protein